MFANGTDSDSKISDWKASQHAGRCGAKRCPRYAAPGDPYCSTCGPKERARNARAQKRRRQRLEADAKCIEGCGRTPKRERKRCTTCLKRRASSVTGQTIGVHGQRPKRGHFKTEVFSDGAVRTRFVGQSHRGGPTRDEQDASADKLAGDAIGVAQSWRNERAEIQAEIDTYPRIQRAAGRKLFASRLAYAGRLLLQAAAEYGDDEARGWLRKLEPDAE